MPIYKDDRNVITPLFDQIRRITETEDAMTFERATESLLNVTPGENLPEAESVSFSAAKNIPDERYSIGHNWFARVVERLRVMINQDRDFTPEEIVYWLGRVAFIPQGHAESSFSLDFASGASGILPTVYKGTASSEFTLNFESSAVGALSE